MSYRGRGRGGGYNNNFQNRGNFGNQQQNVDAFVAANAYPIEIVGWNGASSSDCISFISRKCRIVVSNYSVDHNTGVLKGYVRNESQANELLNWSGVKFAGQSLRFSKGPSTISNQMGGSAPGAGSTIETITNFLKGRYQPEIKMLNLSGVKQDATLNAQGFFASVSVTSKFFPALMKIASDLKIDVESVDLSNNELNDLQAISSMTQTFPKLKNLSLQNNNLSRTKVFETWKHKLNFLRELILFNNPIVQTTNPAEIQDIKLELMRCFPRLVILNGELLRNEQVLEASSTSPFGSQAMFFQDEDTKNIATNFVANYLNLWDTNRSNLMVLYQNESQFSMQLDTTHPHLIEDVNSSSNIDFGNYMPNSRNLTRISSGKARMSKLTTGAEQIYKSFQQLPKTKHNLVENPSSFSMECYKYAPLNGIVITVHGSFEETAQPEISDNSASSGSRGGRFHSQSRSKKPNLSKKSFDRTFIVLPGPNGSMVVASDLLLIRPFTSETPWSSPTSPLQPSSQPQLMAASVPGQQPPNGLPGATSLTAPAPAPSVPSTPVPSMVELPPEIKSNLQVPQQELLVKIIVETKLNLQYAVMLCEQSQWDYNQSMVNFKNSASSLPRDAFI
ncbi:Mex67 nuclear export protein [Candida orthopsilosis Co 90-125]|uniref:Mex67 nuclear export protein n=1 Tax=Candida orthopsilosis (strain 90-125) TaxID=1136231 RepID=H8X4Y9_CANO9|nr:Mex67 nuclear export protein [Candida orthopsilosis Co 90-125]CCG23082.1 Mex67 nuclear export protein [Candida orthopsilosis Co 90-125]